MGLMLSLSVFLMSERKAMKRIKINCIDCLYCKVSVKSRENYRICYCSAINRVQIHKDTYWQKKKVCARFDDMTVVEPILSPLLKKRA